MIEINEQLSIPEQEVDFRAVRSQGPGGQHVNKTSTQVELRFDIAASQALSEEQKGRIRDRLVSRLTREGVLILSSQKHRSQFHNRQDVTERFAELLRWALRKEKKRKKTHTPAAVRQRRLDRKKRRGVLKKLRSGQNES